MDKVIKTEKGIGPISFDAKQDRPLYLREEGYTKYNELIGVQLKGVKNADKIRINKSDYTPSKRKDKN